MPVPSGSAGTSSGDASRIVDDCRTCAERARCISYGWRSPTGLWFEGAVVLRPRPGCRGFIGRGEDIRGHFGATGEASAHH
jgi:hypothetical protein